jgi:ATP-dependent Lhr-like helicase
MTSQHSDFRAPGSRGSSAFELLDRRIQKWIWDQKWTALNSIQEQAIPAILGDSVGDVVIGAPTAGGKTEAAFLPILTRLAQRDEEAFGFRVLYISPLRALIDDQHGRLVDIAGSVGVEVTPWHSDISPSVKARALRAPQDVLLTTPESLEAFFVVRGQQMARLFSRLQFVVVDELHSFMPSERGKQLQSLLHRLDLVASCPSRRIALSATLNDLERAGDYLRPGGNARAELIRSADSIEVRMALMAFVTDVPPESEDTIAAAGSIEKLPSESDLPSLLFETLRGSNNLLFVNSRQGVEFFADALRRISEMERLPNEFHPHHGSLSKELRRYAESQLRSSTRPATAVCTSTLELGIDIGHIGSIAQIGCPPTVSSMRQRLGRSGRRGGPAVLRIYVTEQLPQHDSSLEAWLHLHLVQTIAQTELLIDGWCEPQAPEALHLSTLLHQILSLIGERGGASAVDAWSILCGDGPFRSVTRPIFVALLRQMGARQLIEQASDGTLLLGAEGERLQRRRDFFAVFHTSVEFTLVGPNGPLGTLPIMYPLIPGHFMVFGGRRWLIVDVDTQRRLATLAPSPAGKLPRFAGTGWLVDGEIRRRMRRILSGDGEFSYIDETATHLLRCARGQFSKAGLDDSCLVERGGDSYLFSWTGDVTRYTLKALLAYVGCKADALGIALRCHQTPLGEFRRMLEAASAVDCDPIQLAAEVRNRESAKYDCFLSDELMAADYASKMIRVDSARAFAREILSGIGR